MGQKLRIWTRQIESEISMALALWPPCSRGEEQGALCKQTVKSNNNYTFFKYIKNIKNA